MAFKLFLYGESPRRAYLQLLLTGIAVLLSLVGALALLYDTPFTFRAVCISNLGNPNYNSRAWWLFSVVCVLGALVLFPCCMYLYHHFTTPNIYLARLWVVFVMTGVAGLAAVGVVNETIHPAHLVLAFFAFGGFGLALFLSLGILAWKVWAHEAWPTSGQFVALLATIGAFIGVILRELQIYGIANPADLNFTEWVAFALIMTWLVLLLLISPPLFGKKKF
jgi:hypothetical protein